MGSLPWQYFYIRTYIHNHSVRISDLVSHATDVVRVNFIHKWRYQQFKVDCERQIFWESFSWQLYLPSEFFARNLLRANRRRNNFRILFWCLAWGSTPGFSSNKPTHYLLYHGDFVVYVCKNQKMFGQRGLLSWVNNFKTEVLETIKKSKGNKTTGSDAVNAQLLILMNTENIDVFDKIVQSGFFSALTKVYHKSVA